MLTSAMIQLSVLAFAQSPAGATPSTTPGAATAAAGTADKSLLGYIHSGGVISYFMVVLSIVALGLIIANLIQLRKTAVAKPGLIASLERLLRERNIDMAVQLCAQKENDCYLARVMRDGLMKAVRSPFGMLELKPALEDAGARELENLDRVNHGIAIMAAVGPMLGLLGTVIGMIGAFSTIGRLEGAARSAELATYMSIALVTTAEGLIIAVPCTIAYALFKKRTDRLVQYCGQVAEALVVPLQVPAGAKAPAPAPAAVAQAARPAAPAAPGQPGARPASGVGAA